MLHLHLFTTSKYGGEFRIWHRGCGSHGNILKMSVITDESFHKASYQCPTCDEIVRDDRANGYLKYQK